MLDFFIADLLFIIHNFHSGLELVLVKEFVYKRPHALQAEYLRILISNNCIIMIVIMIFTAIISFNSTTKTFIVSQFRKKIIKLHDIMERQVCSK